MPIPDPYAPVDTTDDQQARLERLQDAGGACRAVVERAIRGDDLAEGAIPRQLIEAACRGMAQTIAELCPPSADRAAAERCVRLARVLASQALTQPTPEQRGYLLRMAIDDLLRADMQARLSVSLALPAELPPIA